jgi:hypothetical protein
MPLIRSKLRNRHGGFTVSIGDAIYEFNDNDKGEQVCLVDNDDHVLRLISIEEAYEVVSDVKQKRGRKSATEEQIQEENTQSPEENTQPAE